MLSVYRYFCNSIIISIAEENGYTLRPAEILEAPAAMGSMNIRISGGEVALCPAYTFRQSRRLQPNHG